MDASPAPSDGRAVPSAGAWSHERTVALIRAFKVRDVLWDSAAGHYRDKRKKAAAWREISAETGESVQTCMNRIESLLASCRRQRGKIAKSVKSNPQGEAFEPRWPFWEEFRFWRGLPDKEPPDDQSESCEPTAPQRYYCSRRPRRERTAKPPQSKKQSPPEEVIPPARPQSPASTPNDVKTRLPADEFDAYGVTVAAKLRRMDETQRLYAENIINQTLYRGLTFQLSPMSEIEAFVPPRIQQQQLQTRLHCPTLHELVPQNAYDHKQAELHHQTISRRDHGDEFQ